MLIWLGLVIFLLWVTRGWFRQVLGRLQKSLVLASLLPLVVSVTLDTSMSIPVGTKFLGFACLVLSRTAQKGPVLEKNALNRLVHNLLELISKGYNPTDLSQQPSCNFPGKQIKILFHNLYVD